MTTWPYEICIESIHIHVLHMSYTPLK